MSAYLPVALRQQLREADDHRCVYCQTTEFNSGYPVVVDDIIPRSKGGSTSFENLCFACHRYNEFKGAATKMEELLTGEITPFFHPRQQTWNTHFAWDAAGIRILGLIAIGRVTIIALRGCVSFQLKVGSSHPPTHLKHTPHLSFPTPSAGSEPAEGDSLRNPYHLCLPARLGFLVSLGITMDVKDKDG